MQIFVASAVVAGVLGYQLMQIRFDFHVYARSDKVKFNSKEYYNLCDGWVKLTALTLGTIWIIIPISTIRW